MKKEKVSFYRLFQQFHLETQNGYGATTRSLEREILPRKKGHERGYAMRQQQREYQLQEIECRYGVSPW